MTVFLQIAIFIIWLIAWLMAYVRKEPSRHLYGWVLVSLLVLIGDSWFGAENLFSFIENASPMTSEIGEFKLIDSLHKR